MRKFLFRLGGAIGLALLPLAAFAATLDDIQTTFMKVPLYSFIILVILIAIGVNFARLPQDKRKSSVSKIFDQGGEIHSVGPDTPVIECVHLMTAEKIGALIIMDGGRLVGIFTERDALNKVLAAGLSPAGTKVSAVMTKDPFTIAPTTTVAEAMGVITKRRFRHLPIVENGKVLAVVSSGDLTHWLVQDKLGEVKELIDLAAGPYDRKSVADRALLAG